MKKKISLIIIVLLIISTVSVIFFTDFETLTNISLDIDKIINTIFSSKDNTQKVSDINLISEENTKKYCETLFSLTKSGKTEFPLYIYDESMFSIMNSAYQKFLDENPEIFWTDNFQIYKIESHGAPIQYKLVIETNTDSELIEKERERLDLEIEKILSQIGKNMSDYEKAIFVHDYIIKNCEYDTELADKIVNGKELSEKDNLQRSAYGCLVEKSTICSGYAKAYQIIMRKLGIECIYIYGTTKTEAHAWNCINIDGEYYNVDLTWDESEDPEEVKYDYFCFTDANRSDSEHMFVTITQHPACTATRYNYFIYNGYYLKEYSFNEASKIISKQLNNDKVYIKFPSKEETEKALYDLIEQNRIFNIIQVSKIRYSYTDTLISIEIE